ncbi:hypothetical protein Taro_020531 [Colocasia esculenta]|uniref:Uncharacterized protein n=1 Tax=Colocasia esculenta TaxID=4460 RepID=A0A843V2C6_COLES|nr:hypothetical protein [Colocasia esculenta]
MGSHRRPIILHHRSKLFMGCAKRKKQSPFKGPQRPISLPPYWAKSLVGAVLQASLLEDLEKRPERGGYARGKEEGAERWVFSAKRTSNQQRRSSCVFCSKGSTREAICKKKARKRGCVINPSTERARGGYETMLTTYKEIT